MFGGRNFLPDTLWSGKSESEIAVSFLESINGAGFWRVYHWTQLYERRL